MKQLTCEMCGSTDLMKQDGVFVCQTCGCKYSVEEAKEMMVEVTGTVDVSGSTVKVDTSKSLSNLYQLAHRAKDEHDLTNAIKYFDMILLEEPTSWEATFYSAYYKKFSMNTEEIVYDAVSLRKTIGVSLGLVKKHVLDHDEQIKAYTEISKESLAIALTWCNQIKSLFEPLDRHLLTNYVNIDVEIINYLFALGDNLESLFGSDKEASVFFCVAWQKAIENANFILLFLGEDDKKEFKKIVETYTYKIKKYDKDYKIEKENNTKSDEKAEIEKTSSGCYVATAVYGSYDCPEVWTLRRYRDNQLAQTWYGRLFIYTYYAISPTIVKWFGDTGWFKKMWKGKLDKMVSNLQSKGIESTPYEDKKW